MTRQTLEVIRGALLAERSKWICGPWAGTARKYEDALREVDIELAERVNHGSQVRDTSPKGE